MYALKRPLDVTVALGLLLLSSPLWLAALLLVFLQDFHSPFYRAVRVGRGDRDFSMTKIRTMVRNADRSGVTSTSAADRRITPIGRWVRRFKADELTQLFDVLRGDMSLVGPRPQTRAWGVDLYTPVERKLLELRPGITDFASIVFSDEGDILAGAADPDVRYNQVIRPWKSRLALLYGEHASLGLDLRVIACTALAILAKPRALRRVCRMLESLGADPALVEICRRQGPVPEGAPPGATTVFRPDGDTMARA